MENKLKQLLIKSNLEDVRVFKDPKGNSYYMVNTLRDPNAAEYNSINIYNSNAKKVGHVYYETKDATDDSFNYVFLVKIYVKEEYSRRNIGAYALKFLEEMGASEKPAYVEGIFLPGEYASYNSVERFYNKNGYRLSKEGSVYALFKVVYKKEVKKIKENTYTNNKGYKIYKDIKNLKTDERDLYL